VCAHPTPPDRERSRHIATAKMIFFFLHYSRFRRPSVLYEHASLNMNFSNHLSCAVRSSFAFAPRGAGQGLGRAPPHVLWWPLRRRLMQCLSLCHIPFTWGIAASQPASESRGTDLVPEGAWTWHNPSLTQGGHEITYLERDIKTGVKGKQHVSEGGKNASKMLSGERFFFASAGQNAATSGWAIPPLALLGRRGK